MEKVKSIQFVQLMGNTGIILMVRIHKTLLKIKRMNNLIQEVLLTKMILLKSKN